MSRWWKMLLVWMFNLQSKQKYFFSVSFFLIVSVCYFFCQWWNAFSEEMLFCWKTTRKTFRNKKFTIMTIRCWRIFFIFYWVNFYIFLWFIQKVMATIFSVKTITTGNANLLNFSLVLKKIYKKIFRLNIFLHVYWHSFTEISFFKFHNFIFFSYLPNYYLESQFVSD